MNEKLDLIEMTAGVVSAYVGANKVAAADLPTLIHSVHGALAGVTAPPRPAPSARQEPAVPIKRSVTPDYLICLEDGRPFKSLKRYLRTRYGLSPGDYRAKWNLPDDYPMVAPNYARTRSELALQMGLGQSRRKATAAS